MKKIIYISILLLLIIPLKLVIFAEDTLEKNWFELYEQRVEKICKIYLYETKEKKVQIKKIIETKNFQKAKIPNNKENWTNSNEIDWAKAFEIAKETYENNMNNIYKCWVLKTQFSILKIKKDILSLSNNPDLSKEVEKELENKISKIELSIIKFKCNKNENNWIQKLNILKQTTFELCRYHTYLEYLKKYNSKYENLINYNGEDKEETEKIYNSMYLINIEQNRKNQIDNEINHIYKVYPIAFNAYKQYEDNISAHVFLELIKDDYKIFRNNLHKVLNPINQVIYKVSNAMQP